jgi:hypothetical protein
MKPIRLTSHARLQCLERGATESEVIDAVQNGQCEPAKAGRLLCRYNLEFNELWQGKFYTVKQVVPIIADEPDEIVVITVFTFYF